MSSTECLHRPRIHDLSLENSFPSILSFVRSGTLLSMIELARTGQRKVGTWIMILVAWVDGDVRSSSLGRDRVLLPTRVVHWLDEH